MQPRHWILWGVAVMLLAPVATSLQLADGVKTYGANALAPDEPGGPLPLGPERAGVTSSRYLDFDRNRVFDTLDAKLLALGPDEAVEVIVLLNVLPTPEVMRDLQARYGAFPVTSNKDAPSDAEGSPWTIVPGFAATLTRTQVVRMSGDARIQHIEPVREVRATMSTARVETGVDKAVTDFGVTGDRNGNNKNFVASDIVVCVVDTGIDKNHVDLNEGQVIGWKDYVNNQAAAYDDNGHGTHVSGIAAGQGDGNAAVRGVAYGAALVGVKVLNAQGSGTNTNVVNGINFCANNKAIYGIEVLSMSLGAAGCSDGTEADSQAANNAWNAGLVVVIAAGNEGAGACTIGSPGSAANVITVGAMSDPRTGSCSAGDPAGGWYLAHFSSRGQTADGRNKPDISAPGQCITSVSAGSTNGYVALSGTSMATPFVAGVAALMLDANTTLTNANIKSKLQATAQNWRVDGGADYDYGAGRLQAYDAVKSAGGFGGTGPANPAHFGSSQSLGATGRNDDYTLHLTTTGWIIAGTLIIPSASGAKDFDLYLYDPGGAERAKSEGTDRQEQLSFTPASTGNWKVRVHSYSGSGSYWLDVSAGADTFTLSVNG
jgi:serine protease AprX